PITPPCAIAATTTSFMRCPSDRDRRPDRRMVLVADDLEVLVVVVEERRRPPAQDEARIRERVALELRLDLLAMIVVDVAVAAGPDEVAHVEVALLGEHVREERVARDVERNAEEDVGAALVELAAQPRAAVPLPRPGDMELEEGVARGERH